MCVYLFCFFFVLFFFSWNFFQRKTSINIKGKKNKNCCSKNVMVFNLSLNLKGETLCLFFLFLIWFDLKPMSFLKCLKMVKLRFISLFLCFSYQLFFFGKYIHIIFIFIEISFVYTHWIFCVCECVCVVKPIWNVQSKHSSERACVCSSVKGYKFQVDIVDLFVILSLNSRFGSTSSSLMSISFVHVCMGCINV